MRLTQPGEDRQLRGKGVRGNHSRVSCQEGHPLLRPCVSSTSLSLPEKCSAGLSVQNQHPLHRVLQPHSRTASLWPAPYPTASARRSLQVSLSLSESASLLCRSDSLSAGLSVLLYVPLFGFLFCSLSLLLVISASLFCRPPSRAGLLPACSAA